MFVDFYAWFVFIDVLISGHRVATAFDWPRNGWQRAVGEIDQFIEWDRYREERRAAIS